MRNNHSQSVPMWLKVTFNVLIMLALATLLVMLSAWWLDSWTRHGDEAIVPQTKGMNIARAAEDLRQAGFVVQLSDSVYDSKARPGAVVDQQPKANSRVKRGATVYLTINALSPRQVTLPVLTEVSLRQAMSVLDALGIEHVDTTYVPSDYEDLVLRATYRGKPLSVGARVPVTAHITLTIGRIVDQAAVDSTIADTTDMKVEHLDIF